MNVKLNSLPTRTWNHLKMNDSYLDVEGEFENHIPHMSRDEAEVSWTPAAQWDDPAAAHGLSADITALTAEADTALLETKDGVRMTRPAVLKYCYRENEHAISRLALHAGKESLLSAVILLTSPKEESFDLSALQMEIHAEEGAKIQLYVAQLMGRDSLCIHEISGVCEEGAAVELIRLELGGKKAYSGANIDLKGRESSFTAEVGYHAQENQLLDMNYVALHRGQRTNSLMEACGTLEEHSTKIFRGTIDFKRGCQGSKGTENENVLLMCDEMVNQTIPLILCTEEDVEGNHGASIGQLDEKVLFYLGTRGISREMAQQIIAKSRIESVCSKIPDKEIRTLVSQFQNLEEVDDTEL